MWSMPWCFYGGARGATASPEIFLAPSLAPHIPRKVQNFEFRIYCLLQIFANCEDKE